MHIQITQIKMPLGHTEGDLQIKALKMLGIRDNQLIRFTIIKKSVDARSKGELYFVYSVLLEIEENSRPKGIDGVSIMVWKEQRYQLPPSENNLKERPVVVGSGPAGLFAALILAESGYKPLVIERGQPVLERKATVERFFDTGSLESDSNIQFGEGGAGTFSDGKLNTQTKDRFLRREKVLEALVEAGAPAEILYWSKPHIGTDYLISVVSNLRKRIIGLGGDFRFNETMTDMIIEEGRVVGIENQKGERILTNHLILAIGHSARDTFELLLKKGVPMEQKAFAIGLRIEHPQEMIQRSQFREHYNHPNLPVADYKLTHHATTGRGVYTFCMCPGGYVVNSSSEKEGIVCNGMSYYQRNSPNANSAVLVNVTPEDFGSNDILAGVEFQRKWERLALQSVSKQNFLPIQLFGDFLNNQGSKILGDVDPCIKGQYEFASLRKCLPVYVSESLVEGILNFDRKIKGFSRPDAVLSGVETRSSSPVRILRNEDYESNIKGLFPCGEGAGYAGGIMSAAMDGIRVAEAISCPGWEKRLGNREL